MLFCSQNDFVIKQLEAPVSNRILVGANPFVHPFMSNSGCEAGGLGGEGLTPIEGVIIGFEVGFGFNCELR
jgi:hypothetical protein